MKIGFLHAGDVFHEQMLHMVRERLPGHEVVVWLTANDAPASDFEVLLLQGEVTREMMTSQPKLTLVQTWSAGYEGVDLQAADELGICISNSPSEKTGNAISVAEWAIALMLNLSRHLQRTLMSVRDRSLQSHAGNSALSGKVVCIVGFGGIGRLLAERLQPFGMRIRGTVGRNRTVPDYVETFDHADFANAVADADYVVLCVRAGKDTENMIDSTALWAMKKGAILINVARGSLIDEDALYAAVKCGHIAAAGLDVLRVEPPDPEHPLLTLQEVLITPHIAGFTDLTRNGTVDYVVQVIDGYAMGKLPNSVVNTSGSPRPV